MSDDDPDLQFQLNWMGACAQFAEQCAKARDGNPFGSRFAALDEMIAYMATELWDRNFSQSEIGGAFTKPQTPYDHMRLAKSVAVIGDSSAS